MNEDITEILNRDLLGSKERGIFSNPSEITAHVNGLLDSSYSTRVISVELQEIGWQKCGTSRAKRKHDNRAQCYYWKENRQSKALLSPRANTNTHTKSKGDSSESGESISSINRRFRIWQAEKEKNLAQIRHVEISTSKVKRDHLQIQLAAERGELISAQEVKCVWDASIVYIKQGLYTLPSRFSERFASETDDQVIFDELTTEIDAILNRFARDGERAVTGENEDTETEK